MTQYTLDNLGRYKQGIANIREALTADMRCAGGIGDSGLARLCTAVELLELGVEPVGVSDGLLINDRIVVAVRKRKFRYAGRYKWYWYGDLKQVVERAT